MPAPPWTSPVVGTIRSRARLPSSSLTSPGRSASCPPGSSSGAWSIGLAPSGLVAEVGWEFELIVLDHTDVAARLGADGLRPAMGDNRCWSALTPAVETEVLAGLSAALAAGDVPVDHICAELGPGCLELATEHRPALRSADDAALAKVFTKAFFARRGQTATFMAQLSEGFPGLGGHPSLSLSSVADGRPLIEDGAGRLAPVARAAVGGVLDAAPRAHGHGGARSQLLSPLRTWQLGADHGHLGSGKLQLRAPGRPRRGRQPTRAPDPGADVESPSLPGHVPGRRAVGHRPRPRTARRGLAPADGRSRPGPPRFPATSSRRPSGSRPARRLSNSSDRHSSSTTPPPASPRRRPVGDSSRSKSNVAICNRSEQHGRCRDAD